LPYFFRATFSRQSRFISIIRFSSPAYTAQRAAEFRQRFIHALRFHADIFEFSPAMMPADDSWFSLRALLDA